MRENLGRCICWCHVTTLCRFPFQAASPARSAEMRTIATDVAVARPCRCAYVCLCLGHSIELCKNGCTYQDVVWGLTHRSPRNHGDTDRTNTFAASRGDMTAMRPFAKLLWTSVRFTTACLVCHIVVVPYVRNGFRFEERSRFLTIFISFRTSATTTVC